MRSLTWVTHPSPIRIVDRSSGGVGVVYIALKSRCDEFLFAVYFIILIFIPPLRLLQRAEKISCVI